MMDVACRTRACPIAVEMHAVRCHSRTACMPISKRLPHYLVFVIQSISFLAYLTMATGAVRCGAVRCGAVQTTACNIGCQHARTA